MIFEDNRNYLIDCRQALKEMAPESVDYVLTSPPYNMGSSKAKHYYEEYSDDLTMDEYYQFLKEVINGLLKVTRKMIFFNIQYMQKNKEAVFRIIGDYAEWIKDILIWHKPHAIGCQHRVINHNYEFFIIFAKDVNRSYTKSVAEVKTCFEMPGNRSGNDEYFNDSVNKAIMSKKVAQYFIKNFTEEDSVVLDPFMGTGTTAVVCKENNRKYIGFEISKACFDVSTDRISKISNINKFF